MPMLRVLRFCVGVTVPEKRRQLQELHNLRCAPKIIRINKSRRMRWTGHVARTAATEATGDRLKERDYSEDVGIDERTIYLKELGVPAWIGFIWLRIGTSGRVL
jgi:hypothetical protein